MARVSTLSGRSARLRHGLFLVEGPQGVREAVRFWPGQVRDVYLTDAAAQRYDEIVEAAASARLFVHRCSPEVLDAMSGNAQGVLAVVSVRRPVLAEAVKAARLVAILADVRDPGNAGSVIRVADAAGADAVVLAGDSVEVWNPKVVRSTAGSLFHLPVVTGCHVADAVAACRDAGLQVFAADGSGDAALFDPSLPAHLPTAWLFGNEAWGLPEADRALADTVVAIPLYGHAESLNLATAAAISLYASARSLRCR